MPAEKMDSHQAGFSFSNFNIQDNAGNKATITGTLGIEELSDPDLNFQLDAKDWRALHSTAKDNKEFYGDLLLTTDLKITGSLSTPSVDGNIHILKGTKLTVVNPQQDPELQDTKGIVAFVNLRDTTNGKYLIPKPKDSTVHLHKLAAGSDVNVNISVDKAAEFT